MAFPAFAVAVRTRGQRPWGRRGGRDDGGDSEGESADRAREGIFQHCDLRGAHFRVGDTLLSRREAKRFTTPNQGQCGPVRHGPAIEAA